MNFDFKQEDCTDDELEGEELQQIYGELAETPGLIEKPTPGQILRISDQEADLLTGALINDYSRKPIQVQYKLKSIKYICTVSLFNI